MNGFHEESKDCVQIVWSIEVMTNAKSVEGNRMLVERRDYKSSEIQVGTYWKSLIYVRLFLWDE